MTFLLHRVTPDPQFFYSFRLSDLAAGDERRDGIAARSVFRRESQADPALPVASLRPHQERRSIAADGAESAGRHLR